MSVELNPIGVVRCAVRDSKAMPPLGVPARLELFPQYEPGLYRLEKHSHLWVLAWLGGAERDILQVTPRGVPEPAPEGLHGVFGVRSPARPNPIGLTAARIVRIDGASIDVDYLDFVDGTPIIDLKPYFVARDLIFSARNEQIGRPGSREALRDSLLFQARRYHGEFCPGLALGVRLFEDFRADVLGMTEPRELRVTVPMNPPCLIDAIMGMARASPGRGTLQFGPANSVRFDAGSQAAEYTVVPGAPEDAAGILEAPGAMLFRRFLPSLR
ncbi:MAG: tRNA (N6-threonylcarbamoyladenosine(37)-N6)-methyltransferase TrmO [Rhodospirillales bacterium]